MMDHNNEKDADQEMDQKDENENKNKFCLQNLNIKQGREHNIKTNKHQQEEKTA